MIPIVYANHIPDLGESWEKQLNSEIQAEYFIQLLDFLEKERGALFPSWEDIFRAFRLTPFESTKVVLLGQDPYHGPGQAHGLCFSVPAGQTFPPSLRNIFKELRRDLGIAPPLFGDLSHWAHQGVLLLNSTLTVRRNEAASHQGKGWERFTDMVIERLSEERSGLIFMLWGTAAQKKEALIDTERHHVLKAPHPSPLSAYRGFIGCGHFSQVNAILQGRGERQIDWEL